MTRFVLTLLLLTGSLAAQSLPDPKLTPGAVDNTLIADMSKKPHMIKGIEHNICAPDFVTPPFRVATKSTSIKKKVCVAYGIATGCPGKAWELDDIIAVEVGGNNIQSNLWPQPITEARTKDHQVEDLLGGPKGLVCQGNITLDAAQQCMLSNWVSCAEVVKKLKEK
jgi:hypothetical protein